MNIKKFASVGIAPTENKFDFEQTTATANQNLVRQNISKDKFEALKGDKIEQLLSKYGPQNLKANQLTKQMEKEEKTKDSDTPRVERSGNRRYYTLEEQQKADAERRALTEKLEKAEKEQEKSGSSEEVPVERHGRRRYYTREGQEKADAERRALTEKLEKAEKKQKQSKESEDPPVEKVGTRRW